MVSAVRAAASRCGGSTKSTQPVAMALGREEFLLTQEFLGQMLGVRRPTASETARQLQADGLIRYRRGKITITDGPGLERVSCSCYGIVKAEFDLITGNL
jgi:CRP-like cAMP-binding protein